jgi:hypothetical protein
MKFGGLTEETSIPKGKIENLKSLTPEGPKWRI